MTDIIEQPRAADGGHVPGACNSAGEFISSLEDGYFDNDLHQALRELSAKLNDHAGANGVATGSVTISINFKQDGDVTEIKAAFKVKPPEERRPRSIMWTTEDNRFTRTRPHQGTLFGIRDVTGERDIRSA